MRKCIKFRKNSAKIALNFKEICKGFQNVKELYKTDVIGQNLLEIMQNCVMPKVRLRGEFIQLTGSFKLAMLTKCIVGVKEVWVVYYTIRTVVHIAL